VGVVGREDLIRVGDAVMGGLSPFDFSG
jgi:hypothetical protein